MAQRAQFTRRDMLLGLGAGLVAGTGLAAPMPQPAVADDRVSSPDGIRYCLNTSTIRGQNLPLGEEIELAARLGYDGIEPWIREIEQYRDAGGSLPELRQRIADLGLRVESAIGFANWIVDDDTQRAQGLEQARRDMELVKALGGTRIAAPPAGANRSDAPKLDLFVVAERYHALLEIGRDIGVTPQVEIWGPSRNLSRLGEAVFVAIESGHPDACVLPDVYHIYRGGSEFAGLKLLSGVGVHCFHMNDYPDDRPRDMLTDGDRVYPGDGDAPLTQIIRMLRESGFRGALSIELFNKTYWERPAEEVARISLERMRAAVASAT